MVTSAQEPHIHCAYINMAMMQDLAVMLICPGLDVKMWFSLNVQVMTVRKLSVR